MRWRGLATKPGWRWGLLALSKNWALLAMPFVILLVMGLLRVMLGPGYGLLPLLAIGPASATAVGGAGYTLAAGGAGYTLAAGGVAAGEAALIGFDLDPNTPVESLVVVFAVIAGVTIGGAVAGHIRRRRERELTEVRAVADVIQQVLLRPVPHRAGSLQLAARYLSASTQARIGGDLYAVVPTAYGVRMIVGDAEGKGLPAVQEAVAAMGVFRVAAYQECTLSGVTAQMDATLERELGDEQFVTAVLAEVSPDGSKMEIINCGHPQPLQLGPRGPQLLGPADGSLPLGLGLGGVTERVPFTITLRPGEPVIFYTDGLSEARNAARRFFPLTGCASVQAPADPPTLLGRLSAEVSRYVGHQPHDDMALLLVERAAPGAAAQ